MFDRVVADIEGQRVERYQESNRRQQARYRGASRDVKVLDD